MDAGSVPNDEDFSFGKSQQVFQKPDDGVPLKSIRTLLPKYFAFVANSADEAKVLVAALVSDYGRFAFRCVGSPHRWQQPHTGFVYVEDYSFFFFGFFLIAGSCSSRHLLTFSADWRSSTN